MKISYFVFLSLLSACGSEGLFTGKNPLDPSPQPSPPTPAYTGDAIGNGLPEEIEENTGSAPKPDLALTWELPCPDTDGAAVIPQLPAGGGKATIKGNVDPVYDFSKYGNVSLSIGGSLCAPADQDRDIFLVIDVSGSNEQNDPIVGGTCERLKAVERMMEDLEAKKGVRMAALTFGSGIVSHSNGFHATKAGLFNAMVASNPQYATPLAVYCNYDGVDTNFNDTLAYVENVLKTGRNGVTKEIYFTSDGYANVTGQSPESASARANRLKYGVLWNGHYNPLKIIGVKVKINDGSLYQMSSADANGNKYYADVSAGELDAFAEILSKLSRGVIEKASFQYRSSKDEDFKVLDLLEFTDKGKMDLDLLAIKDFKKTGTLEFRMEYSNSLKRTVVASGSLNFPRLEVPVADQVLHVLPAQLEAESYREGGQGTAYSDRDAEPQVASEDGVTYVHGISQDEWMAYDIEVETAGMYFISVRYRLAGNTIERDRGFAFLLGDEFLQPDGTGPYVGFAKTDGWQVVKSKPLRLEAGKHLLKVIFFGGGFDIDQISIGR